ncbi:MAG: sigma 54-interacting transcriptional regulator [Anaeromicrobium sp.]|uniref:sigma 54-interacting transcriptional regulator n=1 Tax=Anaeromicrobium sp. TaxID=1929132 RepID=UPI0025F75FE6|nr:sigma 54-interacting transcriptional regulator [Anaeromicrobium sp.]MCT4595493.1 sigma 54-interacting transcriptional regulator [Anaeromicrobium sp.]
MKVKDYIDKGICLNEQNLNENVINIFKGSEEEFITVTDEEKKVLGVILKNTIYDMLTDNTLSFGRIEDCIISDFKTIQEDDPVEKAIKYLKNPIIVVDRSQKYRGKINTKNITEDYLRTQQYLTNEFNAIIDSTYNGILAINRDKEIVVCNDSAENILGLEGQKNIGRNIQEVLQECRLVKVLESGKGALGREKILNDRNLSINTTPVVKEGVVVGAVAIFQDISNLRKVKKALEAEKNATEVLRSIINNAYDGIVVVNKDGYITMMNEPYAQFLGVERKKVIGKHVTDIIEGTRVHIVAKTGKEEFGQIQKIRDKNVVVMRTPILKESKVIGAIGKILFKDLNEINVLASKISQIERELKYYKNALKEVSETKYSFDNIIGKSNKLTETKYLAQKASHTSSNVLIRGESGTGKELFAHAIHKSSKRNMGPFIKVNCAAIPDELLESELFGYEEGAFTGAKKGGKIGKFELANGGSIFLDEIGDMPQSMQAKLLRVLQEKEVERVGGTKSIKLDVRIVAATNRDLEEMVKNNQFREDLYYRLNVMSINVPPLRDRIEDLDHLVKYLLLKLSKRVGNYVSGISNEAMKWLNTYSWPGNVRELENVLERAINLVDYGKKIGIENLPMHITNMDSGSNIIKDDKPLRKILDEAEKEAILKCLKKVGGNRTKAAKILDISRSSLYEKLWRYGIN